MRLETHAQTLQSMSVMVFEEKRVPGDGTSSGRCSWLGGGDSRSILKVSESGRLSGPVFLVQGVAEREWSVKRQKRDE